jgi:hypothetical protein
MQPEQEDDSEDDGGEENLADMIVENLLIGVGSVAEGELLLNWRFSGADGTECGWYVLFYVHVLDSLELQHRDLPAIPQRLFMGSSPVSRGKGVYNKGSPSLQLLF